MANLQEPPNTLVGQQDPASMEEATKRFFAGEAPSPFVGDTRKSSTITQQDNRVQADNLVGHDSHAPAPPVAPALVVPESDTENNTPPLLLNVCLHK